MINHDAITHQLKNKMDVMGLSSRNQTPDSGCYRWKRKDVVAFAISSLDDEELAKIRKLYRIKSQDTKKVIADEIMERCNHWGNKHLEDIPSIIIRNGVYNFLNNKYKTQ